MNGLPLKHAAAVAAVMFGLFAAGLFADEPSLQVLKVQDALFARSDFSPQYDVVLTLTKGRNGQIDFQQTGLVKKSQPMNLATCQAAEKVHHCADESTPWQINGVYIGANHGWSWMMQVTSSGHGLASPADLGSAWTDARGARFYLVKVIDAEQVWMMPDNAGSLERWKFHMEMAGPELTREGTSRKLPIQKTIKAQLVPSSRIRKQEYRIDGSKPLADGEVVTCRSLELVEEYDIVNPAAVLAMIKERPGQEINFVDPSLGSLVTNRIVYRLEPYGGCTVEHDCTANMPFDLGYMGFVQARAMVCLKNDSLRYYIPRTRPFTVQGQSYDFRAMQDFGGRLPVMLQFGPGDGNVESAQLLPDRFVQILGRKENGQDKFAVGFAFGYSTTQGLTEPATRTANCGRALMISPAGKSYPIAVDRKMGRIQAGQRFQCVAYRRYFDPIGASTKATSVYWRPEGEAYVLYADYHQPVEADVVKLPPLLTGYTVSVLESVGSVKLLSGPTVPQAEISLSVPDHYGFIVLRLEKSK